MTNYEEICLKYFGKKINLDTALDEISKLPKSWNTKEWKEKREIILKDKCEVCGTNESLQVQHTRHPKKISQLKAELRDHLVLTQLKKVELTDDIINDYKERFKQEVNGCDICLRKATKGKCPNCKKIIEGNQIVKYYKIPGLKNIPIEAPLEGKYLDTIKSNYLTSLYSKLKNQIWDQFSQEINEFVFRQSYIENMRYLSMVDTITACKKCAARQDWKHIQWNRFVREMKTER